MDQSKSNSLNEYVSDWWEEQRQVWGQAAPLNEQIMQDMFSILACALGPLKREDLCVLMEGTVKTVLSMDEILDIIQPFFVGDGVTQGYVFRTSQIGEYFYNRLKEDERLKWEAYFLDRGRQIVEDLEDGTLAPDAVPAYVIQYYGAHLELRGGEEEGLFSLVSDAWRRAWEASEGAYGGFPVDIERAWRAAVEMDRNEVEKGQPASQIGMEVRCALCKSSVVSVASGIPPVMLGALVEKKVWAPAQGLAFALSVPDCQPRLAIVAPHLSEELLRKALVATLETEDWQVQSNNLIELIPYLPEEIQREALGVLEVNLENWALWGELEELAPYLSEEFIRNALAIAQGLEDWRARAYALVALTPHLSDKQLQEVLTAARKLENVGAKAFMLVKTIPYLPEADRASILAEVLDAARSSKDELYGVPALTEVIRHLPEVERDEIFLEVLEAFSEIEDELFQLVVLEDLAPYMTESLAKKILAVVRDIKTSWIQASALDKIAPYLSESLLRQALAITKAIEYQDERAGALASLAPHMSETLLRESLKEALVIDKEGNTVGAVAMLIPHLPEKLLWETLAGAKGYEEGQKRENALAALALRFTEIGYPQEAFKLMREVQGTWAWIEALSKLVPHLPEAQFREVLEAAWAIDNNWMRAEVLTQLIPHVPEVERAGILQEVLVASRVSATRWERREVLPKLIPYLSRELLQQVLGITQEINDRDEQIEMLITLSTHLVDLGDSQKAMGIIETIENEEQRAVGLAELITHFPESERNDVLIAAMDAARKVEDRWTRTQLLGELAQNLTQFERDEVLKDAMVAALEIDVELNREHAIAKLASFLSESHLREALSETMEIKHGSFALCHLAQRFGELGFPDEGLALAQGIEFDLHHAEAIAGLAPHLPEMLLRKALAVVNEIGDNRSRGIGLAGLANYLPGGEGIVVFQEALSIVKAIADECERSSAISDLVQYSPETALQQILSAAKTIEYNIWREMALESLAYRYHELGRPEDALKIALMVENDWHRTEVLAELAPYLSEELLLETLTLAKGISNSSRRRNILAGLSIELAKLPRLQLFELWQDILLSLATYPREELLQDLCALMPVIAELGGTEGLVDIAQAVGEVGKWWM